MEELSPSQANQASYANQAMHLVEVEEKRLSDYAPFAGNEILGEIRTLAAPLQGARVVHISATAQGGGVAELLSTLVPLLHNVGLDAQWRVIAGSEEFFQVTKRIHNGLQGMPLPLTDEMRRTFLDGNAANAVSFSDPCDFAVVHDPQPAPLCRLRRAEGRTWIWRCHIDLTAANPTYWEFMRPYIEAYDAAIFSMPEYVMPDLQVGRVAIIPPAIDPTSPKNAPMRPAETAALLEARGVDPTRPLLLQVSRFDPWKDPLGVIDVYRQVRHTIPAVQMVLMGALAGDDPEGAEYFARSLESAGNDPDIHVLINSGGPEEVNAFQRGAAVVLQKSLREGFGLTVTEGLWKARPVIGGNVGGIPLQIEDGVSGYLVSSVAECASRAVSVLQNPGRAAALGERGQDTVRSRFLSTVYLRNYLALFNELRAQQ
jgi:trehalose synthase